MFNAFSKRYLVYLNEKTEAEQACTEWLSAEKSGELLECLSGDIPMSFPSLVDLFVRDTSRPTRQHRTTDLSPEATPSV